VIGYEEMMNTATTANSWTYAHLKNFRVIVKEVYLIEVKRLFI